MATPAFFAPIADAPRPQKIVFGLMGLAAIGAAAWFLLLSPLEVEVQALRTRNASVQAELLKARAIVADVARFKREIAALETTLSALAQRLPNERETPPLYRSLSDAAYKSGLAVSLFQPRAAQIRDYYAEIPITFTAEGTYHQFGSFFERVANLSRVVNVGTLTITGLAGTKDAKPSAGSARAELILATYMYRPVGSPPAPKPGAKPGARPGRAAAPTKPAGAK